MRVYVSIHLQIYLICFLLCLLRSKHHMWWMLDLQEEHNIRIQMNLTLVSIQICQVLNIKCFYNVNKYIKPILRVVSLLLLTVMRFECLWWLKNQLLWEVAQQVGFLQLIVEWICYNLFVYQEILFCAGSDRKNNPLFTSLWMPSPCLEVQTVLG